jgi:putative oxidoreductase
MRAIVCDRRSTAKMPPWSDDLRWQGRHDGRMSTSDTVARRPRAVIIVTWILRIFTSAIFIFFGARRLFSTPGEGGSIGQLGFGDWFRYLIGVLEVLGGIGLLLPLFAGLAAVCLAALMVGAMSVELFVVDGGNAAGPFLCFALSVTIAVLMWRRILAPFTFARRILSRE